MEVEIDLIDNKVVNEIKDQFMQSPLILKILLVASCALAITSALYYQNACASILHVTTRVEDTSSIAKGIPNVGNTCFLNAALQIICNTKLHNLWQSVNENSIKEEDKALYDAISVVIKKYMSQENIQTKDITDMLDLMELPFGSQHDSLEAFQKLMAPFATAPCQKLMAPFATAPCQSVWTQTFRKKDGLDEQFDNDTLIAASIVSLEVFPKLKECWEALLAPSEVEREGDQSFKRSVPLILPPILVMSFQRTVYDLEKDCAKKLDDAIECPSQIFFKANLDSDASAYSLKGFVVHSGGSAKGGHYYACVQVALSNQSPCWLKLDDRDVFQISEAQALLHAQQSVYLVYEKSNS